MDSEEAVVVADKVMSLISYHAISASADLAKERGSFPTFEGSNWSKGILTRDTYKGDIEDSGSIKAEDWEKLREKVALGMRNAQVLANAPNASIAYQLGCEQSIEPPFSVLFTYKNKSGDYLLLNRNFHAEMEKRGLWSLEVAEKVLGSRGDLSEIHEVPEEVKRLYRNAFEMNGKMLIRVNAARQKWVCQGISFNLYNPGTSLKYLHEIYIECWKQGLKSTYYLRSKPASEVSQVTTETIKEKETQTKETQAQACSVEAMINGGSCEMCEG